MNILLTSAGRRTYLVRYFKEAMGSGSLLYASNSELSPALCEADHAVISPLIYSEDYIPFLLELCRKHDIKLIVPLFDVDVWKLSTKRELFISEGIVPAVSSMETIRLCNDKKLMAEKLSSLSIDSPAYALNIREYEGEYPVYIKPRFGMGSIGLYRAASEREAEVLYDMCLERIRNSYLSFETEEKLGTEGEADSAVLLQEEIRGSEYGLDIINDFNGRYKTTVVRKKLAMRSGETDEALVLCGDTEEERILSELGRRISEGFGHIGNMDVDIILDDRDKRPYVLDMNVRFGGGYPFSHAAGIDLPGAYICWAEGREAPKELLTIKRSVHAYKDIDIRIYDR